LVELKKWREARKPIFNHMLKIVVTLEAELLEAALKNEPASKIDQLADSIMQNRVKIIHGKALCRDNMKRILDDAQYKKVLTLYKQMHH
jgi:hypothetical protein